MTWALIGTAALGAVIALALRCRHAHEMYTRLPDGRGALECAGCGRVRPNILAPPLARAPEEASTQEVEACLRAIARREAAARVRARYGGRG